uniref:Uncharacterized protein n=1 Tax=Gossypium raimondii TaxID=29730 RepID=A0A0D2SDL3_GOSRA|nr:hypothetical protein B456_005G092900 [Gossypium raimondii]
MVDLTHKMFACLVSGLMRESLGKGASQVSTVLCLQCFGFPRLMPSFLCRFVLPPRHYIEPFFLSNIFEPNWILFQKCIIDK